MKIGPRIMLATALLLTFSLGLYGWMSLRARNAELEAELEHDTVDLALAIAAAIEAEAEISPTGDPMPLIRRLEARRNRTRLEVIRMGQFASPSATPDALERARRVQIGGAAVSQFVPGTPEHEPFFALSFPVRRGGRTIGVLQLVRDTSFISDVERKSALRLSVTLSALVLGLTLAVAAMVRATVSRPLGRMLSEIGEVAKGDLSRTVFAARSDEVGQFAARFNEMTASLRDARAETQRGIETRLDLETRLHQSEKLAAIGQLAAEIAHEVGTPLNVIGGRARTMEKKAGDPEEVARNAGIIAAQAARISKIIQRLIDYARRGRTASTKSEVDLNRVVREALEFLEYQVERASVSVAFQAAEDGERIPGDPDAIQQVCLNLILNAVQAMPSGGRLEVHTETLTRRKEGLEAAPPARFACLQVSDTGVGIPESDRAKILEPFYSTKDGGSGLGLAVTQGIVKDHDGWIEMESRTGGGTTFRVFLPATAESLKATRA